MKYRSVGNRCAVCLNDLQLPSTLTHEKALEILLEDGFRVVKVDMLSLAWACVGVSQYRLGAKMAEAPDVVNCSGLVKWLYGKRGIWLPRLAVQQRERGEYIFPEEVIAGDLVFATGLNDYYMHHPSEGVGHVGIATGDGRVIHAASEKKGIAEHDFRDFIGEGRYRGIKRYIPQNVEVLTLETPSGQEVETSDDIRWIILRSLPRQKLKN